MKQNEAVCKAMDSLRTQIEITEDNWSFIYDHLYMLYAVGYDAGRNNIHSTTVRPIVQYKEGCKVREFISVSQAARELKVHRSSIEGAIRRAGACAGYTWTYV